MKVLYHELVLRTCHYSYTWLRLLSIVTTWKEERSDPKGWRFFSFEITLFFFVVINLSLFLLKQVSPKKTLITPVQCKSLWRQFKAETEYTVTQAIAAQAWSHLSFLTPVILLTLNTNIIITWLHLCALSLIPHVNICFQEANKRNNNWLPPPWAILAIVILGFNEFMTLLR